MRVWNYSIVIVTCLLFSNCISKKINSLDKKGLRNGTWLSYYDSDNKLLWIKTQFKHGKSVGNHYYYSAVTGFVERRELYRWYGKTLKIWLYHPNGKLRMKGKAIQEEDEKEIHFYFKGPWKVYTDSGELTLIQHYEKGKVIKTERLTHHKNDSLKLYFELVDKRFSNADKQLTDSINMAATVGKKNYYRHLKQQADSLIFSEVLNYLIYNGYPSKKEIDEAATIPFYILSFAPLPFKEVALPYFEEAAQKQDIELKSLAFFIDKIRIAKNQKQVYGTQFYFEGNKQIFYPSENPEQLNERRKKMGLE